MATNFPSSPSNGATHTFGGTVYTYNSTKGVWKAAAGEAVTISDTPPSNPGVGDLWFDSSVAKTYVYYNDGSSNQWVQMNPSGGSDGAEGAAATGDGESPIIYTEPPTSHTLNLDGSTSTVQMQAVDPEGTAITYGIAYANSTNALPDQLASATTIDQSTGTYTFTPTTTTSNEGTFKARLSASDGITSVKRFVNFALLFEAIQSGYSSTGTFTDAGTTYDYYEFTSDSSITPSRDVTVQYLLVAGGGDHGNNGGGGGGAGGLLTGSTTLTGGQTYNIVIGQRGTYAAGTYNSSFAQTYSGTNSTFNGLTAVGGGGGGSRQGSAPYTATTPANGGSGGGHGGSDSTNFATGQGTAGQGNNGGSQTGTTVNSFAGGGGGAGSAGANATSGQAGNGGDGLQYNFRGSNEYFSVGGGGGRVVNGSNGVSGTGGATCVAGRGGSVGDALDPQNGILLLKIARP